MDEMGNEGQLRDELFVFSCTGEGNILKKGRARQLKNAIR